MTNPQGPQDPTPGPFPPSGQPGRPPAGGPPRAGGPPLGPYPGPYPLPPNPPQQPYGQQYPSGQQYPQGQQYPPGPPYPGQPDVNRRRDRRLRIGLVVVAALVVLGAGGFLAWQEFGGDSDDSETTSATDSSGSADESDPAEGGGQACSAEDLPSGVPASVACGFEATGPLGMGSGVGTGEPDARVVVELYEDFMCPHCAAFEAQTGELLAGYVESGDVRIVRYPMTLTMFGEPTELAANAYGCAADVGRADEYATELFANSGTVWDRDSLVHAAETAGVDADADFVSCVNDGGFGSWIAAIDSAAEQRGVAATPTVFVNGEEVALGTTPPTEVEAAIEAALRGN